MAETPPAGVPPAAQHPNGAVELTDVYLHVGDDALEECVDRYSLLLRSQPSSGLTGGAWRFHVGDGAFTIMNGACLEARFPVKRVLVAVVLAAGLAGIWVPPATADAGPAGWSAEPPSYTARYYAPLDTVLAEVQVEVYRPCTNCAVTYARGHVRASRTPPFITGVKVTEVALGIVGGPAITINPTDVLDGGGTSASSRTRAVRVQEDYGPHQLRARGDIAYRAPDGRLIPHRLTGDPTMSVFRVIG